MQGATLIFLIKDDQILLAMKKRGVGIDKWNGVGGKIQPGESIMAAAIRECQEEIDVTPLDLEYVARIAFSIPDQQYQTLGHIFLVREWEGEPQETEEMAPAWFKQDTIPYDRMWSDDELWLDRVLAGEKLKARFIFDANENVTDYEIVSVERLEPEEETS